MNPGEKLMLAIVLLALTLIGVGAYLISFRFGCLALGIAVLGTAWKIMAWRRD